MNRKNPGMTEKLKLVLLDEKYQDPRQFTTTIYREDGSLIPEPDRIKMTEERYFSKFIPLNQARTLARKLLAAEARDVMDPLIKREDHEQLHNPFSPSGRRGRLEDGDSSWIDSYDWKTSKTPKDK